LSFAVRRRKDGKRWRISVFMVLRAPAGNRDWRRERMPAHYVKTIKGSNHSTGQEKKGPRRKAAPGAIRNVVSTSKSLRPSGAPDRCRAQNGGAQASSPCTPQFLSRKIYADPRRFRSTDLPATHHTSIPCPASPRKSRWARGGLLDVYFPAVLSVQRRCAESGSGGDADGSDKSRSCPGRDDVIAHRLNGVGVRFRDERPMLQADIA
jgi:hypothetical protein